MVSRFHIQDFFMKEQTIDVDMIRCLQRLCQKKRHVEIMHNISDLQLVETLKETFEDVSHNDNSFSNDTNGVLHFVCIDDKNTIHSTIEIHSFQKGLQGESSQSFRRIEKPWGYEEIWTHTDSYVGKRIYIKPHHRLSLQFHQLKKESIYVQEGLLLLWTSAEGLPQRVPSKHFFHVPTQQIHRFGAEEKGVLLLEVSTIELDDVVRIEDDFGRIAKQ